jgi:SAM-dependent methyltransferase
LSRNLRYVELGCGRGYGTSLLAASNPNIEFVGIDFNPSHVAEARSLAARASIPNVMFLEMSFADAAASDDPMLSNFDIAALHGIYTWVERSVREDIHNFLRKKLLAGGVVYNSYNTLPGWATVGPLQQLIKEVAHRSSRNSVAIIGEAQELLRSLVEHSSAFIVQNPGVRARLESIEKQDRAYLAHEFMNSGWEPIYVTEAIKTFAEAKLTYIGSATLPENRIDLCVPKDLQALVRNAPDPSMRELLKDYAINKQFRRDLYVRGPQKLSINEQRRRISQTCFMSLLAPSQMPPKKLKVPAGDIALKKDITEMILNVLSDGVATGAQILAASQKVKLHERDVLTYVLLLVQNGSIAPAYPTWSSDADAPARRMNRLIMKMTIAADTHRFLASPATGSAIVASFLDRIFGFNDFDSDGPSDLDIARMAFDALEAEGQSFKRDGKPVTRSEADMTAIAEAARDFRQQRLPLWRAIGVI